VKVAGVYLITRIGTDQHYVGSSVDVNKRWSAHRSLLRNSQHHATYLQHTWNKFGESAFSFTVVQEVKRTNNVAEMKKALIDAEQFWFALYSNVPGKPPAFNSAPIAGSVLGIKHSAATIAKLKGRVASLETRAKMSAAGRGIPKTAAHVGAVRLALNRPDVIAKMIAKATGRKQSAESKAKTSLGKTNPSAETRARISAANARRVLSPEARANMSESQRRRPPCSAESREKMSAAQTIRWANRRDQQTQLGAIE
jgi:group I intron endonuclease